MRHSSSVIVVAAALALALAGCASKPKPGLLAQSPGVPPPASSEAPRAPESERSAYAPGSQEDLAATAGDRVFFAVDRHDLEPEALQTLARQAAWLARYANAKVLVAGHADERGTREYNLALGGRRAEAARQRLIANGVAAGRIASVSYGKERPIDSGSGEAAWARNRNAHTMLADAASRAW